MNSTAAIKMTELFGFEMEQSVRTMIIDLLVAAFVITLIVLPQFCCQVSGPMLKPRDGWEDIIQKHQQERKLQDKER